MSYDQVLTDVSRLCEYYMYDANNFTRIEETYNNQYHISQSCQENFIDFLLLWLTATEVQSYFQSRQTK